jgi:hypothetical protein
MSTPTLTPGQLYELIKQYEAEIPVPAPFVTVNVGTFDAATGTFTGLKTQVITDPEPLPHEPGQQPRNPAPRFVGAEYVTFSIDAQWRETITREPAPIIPVAPVLLQFSVANTVGPWSVTVGGFTTTVAAGQTSVSVNVWDRTALQWTLAVGTASHQDRLVIQRKASIPAAGGFMIPMLPVAIIYAPPVDSARKSTATYGQSDTVGTSVVYDFSTDTSQTVEPAFTDGSAFHAFLGLVATGLGIAGTSFTAAATEASAAAAAATDPATIAADQATAAADKAAGTGDGDASKDITSLIALLPSDTMTEQQGLTTDDSTTVTMTYTSTSTIGTTAAGGGPGVGDVIVFFKDVVVAWAYNGGSLELCPVGWTEVTTTAAQLQSDPGQVGISASDQQLLLSLDPFVAGGPNAQPPAGRFTVPAGVQANIEYGGGASWNQQYTVTRDIKTLSSQKSYTTDTSTWNPGEVLQALGFGTSKSQTTTTLTTASGTDTSDTVTLDANLFSGPSDLFVVTIWYDSLFGTWAFQQLEPASQPVVAGQGVAPGQVVTLEAGGRVHATVADAEGRYEFRAPNIAPGRAQVVIGKNPPITVEVSGGPFQGPPIRPVLPTA